MDMDRFTAAPGALRLFVRTYRAGLESKPRYALRFLKMLCPAFTLEHSLYFLAVCEGPELEAAAEFFADMRADPHLAFVADALQCLSTFFDRRRRAPAPADAFRRRHGALLNSVSIYCGRRIVATMIKVAESLRLIVQHFDEENPRQLLSELVRLKQTCGQIRAKCIHDSNWNRYLGSIARCVGDNFTLFFGDFVRQCEGEVRTTRALSDAEALFAPRHRFFAAAAALLERSGLVLFLVKRAADDTRFPLIGGPGRAAALIYASPGAAARPEAEVAAVCALLHEDARPRSSRTRVRVDVELRRLVAFSDVSDGTMLVALVPVTPHGGLAGALTLVYRFAQHRLAALAGYLGFNVMNFEAEAALFGLG